MGDDQADLSDVYGALQRADAAGDTSSAQQLADYIRSQSAPAAPAAAPTAPSAAQAAPAAQPSAPAPDLISQLADSVGDPAGWKRAAGLTARNALEGLTWLPTAAGDAIAGLANYIPGVHLPLPSQTRDADLDALGLPKPQTALEKGGGLLEQGLAGGGATRSLEQGALALADSAPANYASAAQAKAQVLGKMLRDAQAQGHVVPPATTNPTFLNQAVETIAGKENVQNFARIQNDNARTAAASQSLNLNPGAPLTEGATQAVVKEANQAFENARAVPRFNADAQYNAALDTIERTQRGVNADFPGASSPDVAKLVATYRKPSMTGDSTVSAINLLRDQSKSSFSAGDAELGRAQRAVAQALEGVLERQAPEGIGAQLAAARVMRAKAGVVQDSLIGTTVQGPKLVSAEPLNGPLKTSADFAEQYPKANLPANSSPVNHLGMWGGVFGGGLGAELLEGTHPGLGAVVGAAAVPAVRWAARRYALSAAGQAGAIPAAAAGPSSNAASAATRFLSQLAIIEQQRQRDQIGRSSGNSRGSPAVIAGSSLTTGGVTP